MELTLHSCLPGGHCETEMATSDEENSMQARPMTELVRATVASIALALMPCGAAIADTLTLNPVADNTLIEDPAGAYSAGASYNVYCGRTGSNGSGTLRRALIRFDLSAIPQGSTVTAVQLRMYMSQGQAGTRPHSLYRVLASWGEAGSFSFGGAGAPAQPGDATWVHRSWPGTPWATPGGDFAPSASATQNIAGIAWYTWGSTPGMVADVQSWVNGPEGNFGWMVRGEEVVERSAKRFDSRQSSNPNTKPQLIVTFTPPVSNPADVNGDGAVNGLDLSVLLGAWGTSSAAADIDGNGIVDALDLAQLLAAWTG
jgi:hypothetical protein